MKNGGPAEGNEYNKTTEQKVCAVIPLISTLGRKPNKEKARKKGSKEGERPKIY